MKLLILNGPNLNLLGIREPEIYGSLTQNEINSYILNKFNNSSIEFVFFQSNFEGELIEKIHSTNNSDIDGIVYNPGAHTHYSYAIHDAITSVSTPVIEVHLSNIKARESFRQKSVIAPACECQIAGKGKDSYIEAIKKFINNDGDILWKRAVKTKDEIKRLKEAQKIADDAFCNTLPHIKVGMTEKEVKELLEKNMLSLGAEKFSFDTLVGAGANASNIHAEAGDRVIKNNSCIVIDFGVIKNGVCSDTTRTLFTGRPHGELLRAWMAVKEAHETVAENLKIGMSTKQCHEMAVEVLLEFGFGNCMPHGLGHGVGRDIHEKPVLSPNSRAKLEQNNVVTIEPGVYIKDKFGIRLEDCGVVSQGGFESFTNLTHDMIVI